MSRGLMKIDPTQTKFCYNLTEYDCYFLRTGKCSLYLSDEEAEHIRKDEEGLRLGESHVMNCRNLMNSLLEVNYYDESKLQSELYSIRMNHNTCGHFDFVDGQHRSCIAKHLGRTSMFAEIEISEVECAACNIKNEPFKKPSLKDRLVAMVKKKSKTTEQKYVEFIDEDYMVFNYQLTKESEVK